MSERYLEPIPLRELLTADPPAVEWLVEPILLARKATGLVSRRGIGKSLLALELACKVATGESIFHQPEGFSRHVVYVDQEMGPEDLYDRLTDLGYTPDHRDFELLETYLHYYQLVDLPPLNTSEGGGVLIDLCRQVDAELVVIDTLSRVVAGSENEAETYIDLYRHTESQLKRRGVALLRLDHLGKDKTAGSRGASAKEDPLDVVWELQERSTIPGSSGDTLLLVATKNRGGQVPDRVEVRREQASGRLIHGTPAEAIGLDVLEVVEYLDHLKVDLDTSVRASKQALREAGFGRRNTVIEAAVRYRRKVWERGLQERLEDGSERPGDTLRDSDSGTVQGTLGDAIAADTARNPS